MYASHFAEHSKNVICFEAVPPVYEQLEKIKQKHNNVITHNLAVADFEGVSGFYVDDKRLSNSYLITLPLTSFEKYFLTNSGVKISFAHI